MSFTGTAPPFGDCPFAQETEALPTHLRCVI